MATYKVLQDIEAEDKLVGPLTPRQCIYAAIAIVAGYLTFLSLTKGAVVLVPFFLPFMVFGLFFAWPWSKQQSTEVWALAKIRFALKPRRRIWDQSGLKDLVTVTAPKKIEHQRFSDLSETEVRSRLKALADTIDSRGWAVKNVPLEMYTPSYGYQNQTSDRLIDPSVFPREVPNYDTSTATEDMFDLAANPLAQQFETKMAAASNARHQQLVAQIDSPAAAQSTTQTGQASQTNWYMTQQSAGQPLASAAIAPPVAAIPQAATPTAEDLALAEEIKRKQELFEQASGHKYHTVLPAGEQQATPQIGQPQVQDQAVDQSANPPVTANPNPAILELANNNDLNVATIAREAQRSSDSPDEVVVKLH